ncbi:MAG: hypothetical protein HUJ85_02810 [Veillonella sp.]|nr:hypothetical protein [Veillonella sp.]
MKNPMKESMKQKTIQARMKKYVGPALVAAMMLVSTSYAVQADSPVSMNGLQPMMIGGAMPAPPSGGSMPAPPSGASMPAPPSEGSMPAPPPGGGQELASNETFKATRVANDASKSVTIKQNEGNKKKDQNVLLARKGAVMHVNGVILTKTGDTTSEEGSNFNGQNAAVLATKGSQINVSDTQINTDAEGSNAIFATGENATINVNGTIIHTKKNSSRGLDATYKGTVIAKNVTITTEGAHSASLATDRGEGTVKVTNAKLSTAGEGSPLIYSTGDISLTKGQGQSTGSEIGVIEGKNSMTIVDSDLTGNVGNGFMLYQSFSGDAESGIAKLNASNSKLTTHAEGAFIHVNNTQAEVDLSNNEIIMDKTHTLINAAANRWGQDGENGGHLTLNASQQNLTGNVVVDSISSVTMNFANGSSLTGAVNTAHTGQSVSLHLSKDSVWNLTDDSYVTELVNEDPTGANIHTNGHKLVIG